MAKRVKHVYNNIEHVFFHQGKDEYNLDWGKEPGGKVSFEGNIIKSYSADIGVANFDRKIFYFRAGSYTQTTAKHQRAIKYAIPSGWKVFTWLDWHSFPSTQEFVNGRIDRLKEQKEILYSNKKRDIYRYDQYLNEVTDLAEYTDNPELLSTFLEKAETYKRTEEDTKHATIKEWANRQQLLGSWKNKVRAYEDLEFRLKFFDKQKEVREKNTLKKEKALENLKKELDEYKAEQLEQWYNGENVYFGYYIPPKFNKLRSRNYWSINVYLRISPKYPQVVNTSQGVDIPLIECKFLYKKFRKCIETNTEWHANGEKYRIAKYQLEKIYKKNEHWYLHSGCHIIRDVEIEKFIEKFNLQSWRD